MPRPVTDMRPVTLASLANNPIDVSVSNGDALTVRPGGRFRLPVVLTNKSARSLGWSHQNPLHLAYRWLDADGKMVERDGLRTIIAGAPLTPGLPVEVEMVGASPEAEGSYQLQLSLVLEGVHWACDVGAAGWVQLGAQVAPAPAWPAGLRTSRGAGALRGAMAAAELARQLEGRTLATKTAPPAVVQAEPIATPAAVPSAAALKKRRPVLHRLRDWLRAALGVSGLEHQLNDVLVHVSKHEQHVRDLEAHLVSANDRARQLMDDVAEAQGGLTGHLRSLAAEIAKAQEELSKGFATSGAAAKQQLEQIGDVSGSLRRLIATEASHAKRLQDDARQLSGSLDRGLATIRSADDSQCGILADLHSKLDAQATELARLAEIQSQLPVLGALSPHFDSIKDVQSELQTKIEALGAAQQEVQRELHEGSVVVELISNIRQLIAWAEAAGDIGVIVHVNETLEQLVAQSSETALRGAAQLETLDLQAVSNSLKIDALLTRQAIPLASAGVVLVRNRFGLLAIQDDDAPAIAYYSTGDLPEPATVAIVERLLEPGDCFLDVGANVGIYSLIAGRRVGPGGAVVSVEPSPSTMRALRTTLAINGIAGVAQTHECALGEAEGTATLHCEPTSGHNSLIGPTKTTRETHDVAVKRGEAILDGLKPALIKIDVEGWELDVLKGLERVIKSTKRLSAVVEFSPDHIRRRGMQPDEWLDQLRAFGMTMWVIDDGNLSLRSFKQANEIGDRGANLFLSREIPSALKSMLHDR